MQKKHALLIPAAAAAVALAAGCSDTGDSTSGTSAPASGSSMPGMSHHSQMAEPSKTASHNDADVMFNQMMIPHHQQAIEMADLIDGRTTNPAVVDLAARIKAAQQPEIDEMTARLAAWNVDTSGGQDDSGSDHGGHDMSGMMSADEMAALTAAQGAEFDRLWLTGMIAHHQGAVTMADAELADGIDPASTDLATRVKQTQQAEIDEMNRLLGK
ncbi:DUF305 domain-containing protein [Gordonia sp. CPCC 206044]|uniref:DUF305 domain-containing protein n=1 Tax=Gordonia sp. CPCC 206044 TaxID=3140793 RepID=UPI003AF34D5D